MSHFAKKLHNKKTALLIPKWWNDPLEERMPDNGTT